MERAAAAKGVVAGDELLKPAMATRSSRPAGWRGQQLQRDGEAGGMERAAAGDVFS